jgi:hypothetical protein
VVVISDFLGGEFSPFGDKLFWKKKRKFSFLYCKLDPKKKRLKHFLNCQTLETTKLEKKGKKATGDGRAAIETIMDRRRRSCRRGPLSTANKCPRRWQMQWTQNLE